MVPTLKVVYHHIGVMRCDEREPPFSSIINNEKAGFVVYLRKYNFGTDICGSRRVVFGEIYSVTINCMYLW